MPSFGGQWTQQKLEILQRYLDAYTTALKDKRFMLTYVDAFAGAGAYKAISDEYADYHELHRGSAQIALDIADKPFDRLIFIEKEPERIEALQELAGRYASRQISVVGGDANQELPTFCDGMTDSDRAVVFLDPYATEVSWATVEAIAAVEKIDCWILFPLMAIIRMMPTDREPDEELAVHLDRIFGGRGYWQGAYQDSPQLSFFNSEPKRGRTQESEQIADKYRERLRAVFHSTAETRRTLRNSRNGPLFELLFAVGNPTGAAPAMRIANHILRNW